MSSLVTVCNHLEALSQVSTGIKKTYTIWEKVIRASQDVNLLVRRGEGVALV